MAYDWKEDVKRSSREPVEEEVDLNQLLDVVDRHLEAAIQGGSQSSRIYDNSVNLKKAVEALRQVREAFKKKGKEGRLNDLYAVEGNQELMRHVEQVLAIREAKQGGSSVSMDAIELIELDQLKGGERNEEIQDLAEQMKTLVESIRALG